MFLSLFYIISFGILFLGILYFPKNNKRCSLAVWSVVSLMIVFCIHSASGVIIYNILRLKVNLLSVGIFNIIVGTALWGVIRFVFKRVQNYYRDITGWIVLGILLVCTIATGMIRFGASFNMFRYATSDSAVHFHRVLKIVNSGELYDSRFYLYLIESLMINVLSPFIGEMNYYRIFIMCDLFMWFLSGALFLVLIRKYMADKRLVIWGTAFILLYFFAYPLNNLLYGFNYLGAAVTLTAFVVFSARSFKDGMMQQWFSVMCICLGNMAVALCYTQFLPVSFAGSILYIGYDLLLGNRNINKKAVIAIIGVCGAAGIFGVYYIIFRGYGSLDILFSNLEGEGAIYRDLWSNIFFYLIFVVMYVVKCVKSRKIDDGYFFLLPLMAYAIYFFWRICNEKTASYYFYKFHYIGWLFILYIAFKGLFYTIQKYDFVYRVYAGVAAVLLFITVSGFESRLNSANSWWVPETKADAYFDIYEWNQNAIADKKVDVSDDMQAVYYAVSHLVCDENTLVPYIGSWQEYWLKYYYNLTCQEEHYDYFFSLMDEFAETGHGIQNTIDERIYNQFASVKYIMVEKESDAYWYGIGYFSGLTPVYENDYGVIYITGRD